MFESYSHLRTCVRMLDKAMLMNNPQIQSSFYWTQIVTPDQFVGNVLKAKETQ
jgi:hypothetical protein